MAELVYQNCHSNATKTKLVRAYLPSFQLSNGGALVHVQHLSTDLTYKLEIRISILANDTWRVMVGHSSVIPTLASVELARQE